MNKYFFHHISFLFYFIYLISSKFIFPSRFYYLNKKLGLFRSYLLNKTFYKNISSNVIIYNDVIIPYRMQLTIGDYTIIKSKVEFIGHGIVNIGKSSILQEGSFFDTKGDLFIGSNTVIGKNCQIHTHSHLHFYLNGFLNINQEVNKKVCISNNVLIYNNVNIVAGVNICEGVVVGISSVVVQSINKSGFYAGYPAKLIERF